MCSDLDLCHYLCLPIQYIVVGNAKDMNAELFEDGISFAIIISLLCVNFAVNFDHKSQGVTVKIRDKAGNNMLPSELQAHKPSCPQLLPENCFRLCSMLSVFPCKLPFLMRC